MDDRRVGVTLRMLRRRAGMRQVDVAIRANCHQTTISRAERGSVESLSLMMLRRIFGAVGARFDGDIRWRGGELDRLLDAEHARLVDAVARQLGRWGWTVLPKSLSRNTANAGRSICSPATPGPGRRPCSR